jgi:hypothetical protein
LEHLAVYVAIGFAAQMIDGALGMAYGVTASSFLLTFGVPPVIISASGARSDGVRRRADCISKRKDSISSFPLMSN